MSQPNRQDQIANALATKIITWQRRMAAALNKWISHLSKKQQQRLLAIFCMLSVAGLIMCLVLPYGEIAMDDRSNYQPIHIGLPSERPSPVKSTDSLTLKK